MARKVLKNIDYATKDYEGFRSMMLDMLKEKMPEYTDDSQTDAGIVLLELLATGLDILSYYNDTYANEAILLTAQQRENIMKWCNVLSYVPKYATSAKFKQVFVLSAVRDYDVAVPKGTLIKTSKEIDAIYFETLDDFIIPTGKLGNEKDGAGNYLYTVDVAQGIPQPNEIVGSSDGTASQVFTLKYPQTLVDESLKVYVNEGNGSVLWERVDSFIDSSANSLHYRVIVNNRNYVSIIFGDGIFGRIPVVHQEGIYATYRVGGGIVGNVSKNTITILDSTIAEVDSTFNPDVAYVLGEEGESIESLKVNAPNSFRTKWGALTYNDFSDILLSEFYETVFVSAYENEDNIRDIDLYVLTDNMTSESISFPVGFENRIDEFFDINKGGRKIVGAEDVILLPPNILSIYLTATLTVYNGYSRSVIHEAIRNFLTDYFSVGNYDFNTDLSFTELASKCMNEVEGIKSLSFSARYGKYTFTVPSTPLSAGDYHTNYADIIIDKAKCVGTATVEVTRANYPTFGTKVGYVSKDYVFSYNGTSWYLNGNAVTLSEYGVDITGNPLGGDSFTVTFRLTMYAFTFTDALPEGTIIEFHTNNKFALVVNNGGVISSVKTVRGGNTGTYFSFSNYVSQSYQDTVIVAERGDVFTMDTITFVSSGGVV